VIESKRLSLSILLALGVVCTVAVFGKAPTDISLGTVTDEFGALVPSVTLITNQDASAAPAIIRISALLSGDYEVRAELQGIRTTVRDAQVQIEYNTRVTFTMSVGTSKEVATMEAVTAPINCEKGRKLNV
jgi:hypothetical protein